MFRTKQERDTLRQHHARRGYKRQNHNGLWTTQGRLLHPRPTVPTSVNKNYSYNHNEKPKSSTKKRKNLQPDFSYENNQVAV